MPPPLVREGNKVQTPWLMSFLSEPHPIRPAAQLRMPRFHFGKSVDQPSTETADLANYFAARDGTEFPYQTISEQSPDYLAARSKAHANYLQGGWQMMTDKTSPCIQCHAIGQFKPTGGEKVVNGPDLREVAPRFRPEFLETWIANPRGSYRTRRCPRTSLLMVPCKSQCPRRLRINRSTWFERSAIHC